jgi:hypothetical protein
MKKLLNRLFPDLLPADYEFIATIAAAFAVAVIGVLFLVFLLWVTGVI